MSDLDDRLREIEDLHRAVLNLNQAITRRSRFHEGPQVFSPRPEYYLNSREEPVERAPRPAGAPPLEMELAQTKRALADALDAQHALAEKFQRQQLRLQEVEQSRAELSQRLDEQTRILEELRARVADQAQQKWVLQNAKAELEARMESQLQERHSVKMQLEEKSLRLQELETETALVQTRLAAREQRIKNLETEMISTLNHLEEEVQTQDRLNHLLREAEQQLAERDRKLVELEKELAKSREQPDLEHDLEGLRRIAQAGENLQRALLERLRQAEMVIAEQSQAQQELEIRLSRQSERLQQNGRELERYKHQVFEREMEVRELSLSQRRTVMGSRPSAEPTLDEEEWKAVDTSDAVAPPLRMPFTAGDVAS